jgi:hypothetical protein
VTGGISKSCSKCCRIVRDGGYLCEEHKTAEKRRRTEKHVSYGYGSAHWQMIRKARLQLAGYRCELQLPGCTEVATHVHLAPEARGRHFEATLEQTQACCAPCSGAVDAPRSRGSR